MPSLSMLHLKKTTFIWKTQASIFLWAALLHVWNGHVYTGSKGANIKYFSKGEGLLGRSHRLLSVLWKIKKLMWVLNRPCVMCFMRRQKTVLNKRAAEIPGWQRGLPSPLSLLHHDLEGFQNLVRTCFVVVDQGFMLLGRYWGWLWAEKVNYLSRHGFVLRTQENAYVNPTPIRRKYKGNIC